MKKLSRRPVSKPVFRTKEHKAKVPKIVTRQGFSSFQCERSRTCRLKWCQISRSWKLLHTKTKIEFVRLGKKKSFILKPFSQSFSVFVISMSVRLQSHRIDKSWNILRHCEQNWFTDIRKTPPHLFAQQQNSFKFRSYTSSPSQATFKHSPPLHTMLATTPLFNVIWLLAYPLSSFTKWFHVLLLIHNKLPAIYNTEYRKAV
jgi:hypothetical protein